MGQACQDGRSLGSHDQTGLRWGLESRHLERRPKATARLDLVEPVRTILSGPVGWDGLLLSTASPWKPNPEILLPTHGIEYAP